MSAVTADLLAAAVTATSDLVSRLRLLGTPYLDANEETWVEIAPDRFVFVDEDGYADKQTHSRAEVEAGNGALTAL